MIIATWMKHEWTWLHEDTLGACLYKIRFMLEKRRMVGPSKGLSIKFPKNTSMVCITQTPIKMQANTDNTGHMLVH